MTVLTPPQSFMEFAPRVRRAALSRRDPQGETDEQTMAIGAPAL
jgi:hypothetical protein